MASAQKRGFRFPWGNDGRRDAPEAPDHDDVHEQTLAQRIGAAPDDIGRGPFDLETTAVADVPRIETLDPPDNEAQDEPDDDATRAVIEPPTEIAMVAREEPAVEPAPEPEVRSPRAGTPAPLPGSARTAAAPSPSAWPESDRRATRPAIVVDAAATPSSPAAPRRDNKLMTGLVRAMRDAAKVARDEAVAALRSDAIERGASIRAQSVAASAALRRAADGDVAAIREWSKAEIGRVREETEARIGARKVRLAGETDDAAKAAEDRLAQLAAAVQAYEAETATFFDALLAEDDPARLAGLAERMPSPPQLDEIVAMGAAAPGKGSAAPARSRAASKSRAATRPAHPRADANAAVADPAIAEAAVAEVTAPYAVVAETEHDAITAEPEPIAQQGSDASAESSDVEAVTETDGAADALDAEDAAAAEAEALAGLEGHTQVIASGLVGVAAIAGFKAALVRSPGISAVSVNAGSDGDVLYSVTHAGDTDIRDALRDLGTFQTRLIADDGATLVVVVHEATA